MTATAIHSLHIKHPINVASREFTDHKWEYYRWLREHAPVYRGRMSILPVYFVSRFDDCLKLLGDPRFVRNRTTATGGGRRLPFPLPKTIQILGKSMIVEDEPDHRRLRNLVHKAFTPRALERLVPRIERLSAELLAKAEPQGRVDLIPAYSLPIPVSVIAGMVGLTDDEMPEFRNRLRLLTSGYSAWSLLRTFFWDMRRLLRYIRQLIANKRAHPGDDILTALIQAEDQGERLSENELISMLYLLVVAGYETTVHLITNSVVTLLTHPDQLARLRAQPELMESAIEEVLRFNGPVQGTKPAYATEDVTLHGVTIPKGAMVMPLVGAANRDPAAFENPDEFDIARSPNRHLGFGHGIHYCLGAPLARMETRIALTNLLTRNPNLRLAVDPSELKLQNAPLWQRYVSLPVMLG